MISHLLNRRLQVWRAFTSDDGAGGQTVTWNQISTAKFRMSQPSAREREVAAAEEAELTHVLHTKPKVDVARGDELHDGNGMALEVMATMVPSKSAYLRVECRSEQVET